MSPAASKAMKLFSSGFLRYVIFNITGKDVVVTTEYPPPDIVNVCYALTIGNGASLAGLDDTSIIHGLPLDVITHLFKFFSFRHLGALAFTSKFWWSICSSKSALEIVQASPIGLNDEFPNLVSRLPGKEPRYALYRPSEAEKALGPMQDSGKKAHSSLFVYWCPEKAPIPARLMYTVAMGNLKGEAKKTVTGTIAPFEFQSMPYDPDKLQRAIYYWYEIGEDIV